MNEIVEQQIRRWNMEEERRSHERATFAAPLPIVTISREAGARGTELGRRVAEALGFHFWDQELIHRLAHQSGAPEALLRAVDEHPRSAIEELLAGILMGDKATEQEYLAQLIRLIASLAERGASVVVGRGAQFVVASEVSLRVRVVAPFEARVRVLAAERGLREAEARAEVDRLDRERLAFQQHHYDRDAADPAGYDVLINSATIPIERAADVVVAAYDAKFPGKRETARGR